MISLDLLLGKERKKSYVSSTQFFRLLNTPSLQAYNKELKTLLSQARDDVPPTADIGENPPTTEKVKSNGGGGGGKKKIKLEDLTRFTMVKRIW